MRFIFGHLRPDLSWDCEFQDIFGTLETKEGRKREMHSNELFTCRILSRYLFIYIYVYVFYKYNEMMVVNLHLNLILMILHAILYKVLY